MAIPSTSGIKKTKKIQSVATIPLGRDWLEIELPILAGQYLTLAVTTIPDNDLLSLWEFYFSVYVDTNDIDHIFSSGAALTAGQRKLSIEQWKDFAESSDVLGRRCHKIRFQNFDSVDHTLFVLYKAYTFSSVTGSV